MNGNICYMFIELCVETAAIVAKAPQDRVAVAPALFHLDPKLQIDFTAKKALHILAGIGAHLFEHGTALADDDPLSLIHI